VAAPQTQAAAAATTGPPPSGKVDYVYSVESNYPVTLTYTNTDGDQVTSLSENTPVDLRGEHRRLGPELAAAGWCASSTSVRPDTHRHLHHQGRRRQGEVDPEQLGRLPPARSATCSR
jgi:hypothetical protein